MTGENLTFNIKWLRLKQLQINHMMEDNDKENLLTNEPDEETQSLPEEANEEKRDDKVIISCI